MEKYEASEVSTIEPTGVFGWAVEEFRRISAAFSTIHELDTYHVAPKKARTGMLVIADGTDWDPGAGQGVYCYYNSTWNRLG